jgi:hypothetical protein
LPNWHFLVSWENEEGGRGKGAYLLVVAPHAGRTDQAIRTLAAREHKLIVDTNAQAAAALLAWELDEEDTWRHALQRELSGFRETGTFDHR